MKPILLSGMQPTGRLHIGNYLGALKNFVELQNSGKYRCYFFLADLHALTEPQEPEELRANILNLTADYLAAGINIKQSVIYQQSQIPAHSELTWVLNTITPMGELQRMTQFKDKSARQEANINEGLFNYPVLMAADIILYDAAFVPVGDDQLQHLELTRTLVRKFNAKFGETFLEPRPLLTSIPRVMSLSDPLRKMSKSEPAGCLFLDDSPAEIESKVKRAVTDSGSEIKFDEEKKPAIANLLRIYSSLSGEPIPKLEKQFSGETYSYFKSKLAELTTNHFADFREKKSKLVKKPNELHKALRLGSGQAAKVAEKKIAEVKQKLGIALE
ncbi:MAG: tryptophan--tRNA ligase [Candidatus Liptonbacteria bacterium]|nr:tryptophan--tRNA ligase [Candidatus Liptonbacteria bacterium]